MTTNSPSPKVSIILPTYNRAEFIVETIESILKQTYPYWELLVIDDGSEDNTETLVLQINDERIHFYKAGRIAINSKIKNIGLKKCTGELIAFIDSDDLWAATKLEKQVAALQQYPEAGFSLTGGYNFEKPGEPVDYFYKQRKGIQFGNVFTSFFQSELSATVPSLMLRKESIESAGFFNQSITFADVEFILNLSRHFKAVILFEPLLYRRLHNANDSNANWEIGYNEGIRLIRLFKKELPSTVFRDAFFRLYMNFGEDCLLHKKRKKALLNFFNGWKNKPASIVPLKKIGKAILK